MSVYRKTGDARAHVSFPKGVKAKPGKAAPTVDEQAWISTVLAFGCWACFKDGYPGIPGALHHVVEAGRRLGHRWSYCLCDPGHHQNGAQRGMISLHPGRRPEFLRAYGQERAIVFELSDRLNFARPV